MSEIDESKKLLAEFDVDTLNPSSYIEAKYTVLENRDKLLQLLPKLYEQKTVYDEQISQTKKDLRGSQILSAELKEMLQEVKDKLTLQDIIKAQASKQVEFTFDEQINELLIKIGELDVARSKLVEQIAKFENKKRAKKINDQFKESLTFAQAELNMRDPKIGTILQYGPISKSETGSRAPRAILAYHYALLKTIEGNSTNPMLPVVIDSPKQQDPDKNTAKKLLDLCIDGLSTSNQLILGSVSCERDTSQYKTLIMTEKYSLLKSEQYHKVYNEIMPLYQQAVSS